MSARLDLRNISALEHQLSETFGDPARFGVPTPLPEGLIVESGKLVLAIVAADGAVSERERGAFLDIVRSYGATEAEVEALRTFTPTEAVIERVVGGQKPSFLRCLVYDAIRTARVDGFADKERLIAARVAQKLGLETGLVTAIESQLVVEEAVARARARLLRAPDTRSMPTDFMVRLGQCVLVVAAGDGEIREPEMRWFLGHAKAMGASDEVLEQFLKFDPKEARLEDVLDVRLRPFARAIVFDALRTARADGVTDRERTLAERAAQRLQLDDTFVAALENQLEVETAVREARMHLLAPLR